MAAIKLHKWDSAEHLKTEEDIALYLQACLDEAGDSQARQAPRHQAARRDCTGLI